MSAIVYKRVETTEELQQILKLQNANLPTSLSHEESKTEGFVTVHHNFEILKALNETCAHIIAVHNSEVIGYTLCMDRSFKNDIEVLEPMFEKINKQVALGESYIVMGQVCIDKAFRGKGVFRGLYQHMKDALHSQFDQIITEVDRTNVRSIKAHLAIGFKILYSYRSNDQDWKILYWTLN